MQYSTYVSIKEESMCFYRSLYLLLMIFTLCTYGIKGVTHTKQPVWDDHLDFAGIEEQLRKEPIVELKEMKDYLKEKGRVVFYKTKVYVATLANGLKAVFKPEAGRLFKAYGEVAAYRASQWLRLRLVPPTVLKTHKKMRGSLQFFVESPFDLLKDSERDHAFSLLSEQTKSDRQIFYYIFGQWDPHPGNQLVSLDKDGKAYLALIDNAAFIVPARVRSGEPPFIQEIAYGDDDLYNEPFPFNEVFYISLPIALGQDEKNGTVLLQQHRKNVGLCLNELCAYKKFTNKEAHYVVPLDYILYWNTLNVTHLPVVMWKNSLWVQYDWNSCDVLSRVHKGISISQVHIHSPESLKRYKKLSLKALHWMFEEAIKSHTRYCSAHFFSSILKRRDQLLALLK